MELILIGHGDRVKSIRLLDKNDLQTSAVTTALIAVALPIHNRGRYAFAKKKEEKRFSARISKDERMKDDDVLPSHALSRDGTVGPFRELAEMDLPAG
jgi:hypothetical protein